MIQFSAKHRSSQKETLDDFELKGEQLERMLTDLKRVNNWLGGKAITLSGLKQLLENVPKGQTLSILDLGCGDGEMLRQTAKWARRKGLSVSLLGIDANLNILKEAEKRSKGFEEIQYKLTDVLSSSETFPTFDIAMCNLFIHHFSDQQIVHIIKALIPKLRLGIVINDLHRNWWAFHLFRVARWLLLRTNIARADGLVSVTRGFTRDELASYSKYIKGTHSIRWKWAFRYLWVIDVRTMVVEEDQRTLGHSMTLSKSGE